RLSPFMRVLSAPCLHDPDSQPTYTLLPYTTLFRSRCRAEIDERQTLIGLSVVVIGVADDDVGIAITIDVPGRGHRVTDNGQADRSEEHTSELQSRVGLVCRLLLVKQNLISCRSRRN